ncbi:Calcium-binding EF-hand [Artemisia annua]|uniref:Calcium-binding EF-hand n=1 Tax=Artemisia annua TaxID=35608 RepID=A0A2U1PGF2_ARTAN|nr:Calcium-binding EF-hand [Artemisia annua]
MNPRKIIGDFTNWIVHIQVCNGVYLIKLVYSFQKLKKVFSLIDMCVQADDGVICLYEPIFKNKIFMFQYVFKFGSLEGSQVVIGCAPPENILNHHSIVKHAQTPPNSSTSRGSNTRSPVTPSGRPDTYFLSWVGKRVYVRMDKQYQVVQSHTQLISELGELDVTDENGRASILECKVLSKWVDIILDFKSEVTYKIQWFITVLLNMATNNYNPKHLFTFCRISSTSNLRGYMHFSLLLTRLNALLLADIYLTHFTCFAHIMSGTIPSKLFVQSMVTSGDIRHMHKLFYLIDELDNDPHLKDICIAFAESKKIAKLHKKLQPFSLALSSYRKVNVFLTRKDLDI